MRIVTLAIAGSVCAVLCMGRVQAQTAVATDLRQPASIQQTASDNQNYVSFAPQSGATESPSDQPPAATPPAAPATPADTGAAKKDEEKKDEAKPDEAKPDEPEAFKLFKSDWLTEKNIDIRGWLDQGYTENFAHPANGSNGPVGYNGRSDDYTLDQAYLIFERVTKVENGCGIDYGGRVDLLYGEDQRYVVANGLDAKLNAPGQFYGLALPQMYADLAINDWVFRAGHFLAPCGSESVMAPENFFYSHSYGFLYGQPTTLSGGYAMYKINDQWSANGGLDTGWNDWDSQTDHINYFGGINWTSKDQKTTFAFESFLGDTDQINPSASRFHYCAVLTQKIGEKWHFTFEQNTGYDNGANVDPAGGFTHGTWISFAPYFIYDINACWSAGFRYEWVDDSDGTIIEEIGPPAVAPIKAHYQDLTWGINYKPHQSKNILVRSEIRYDVANDSAPVGQRPFDDGTKNTQLLWATDLIVKF
jgi:hypothetical protein